ncbi:MAG: FAD binding domain-containing protein [Bacteroidetes bacterium]|nr:FAD binding domain-containing protein [Bacteroidota bacterium]
MVNSYIPKTLTEAAQIRKETGAVPIAGGTDLMVRYRNIAGTLPTFPWPVMFISNLEELKGISKEQNTVIIRAGTELSVVCESSLVHPVLKDAVRQMAAPALRNLGTIAGNICNASPAGDAVCVLYALDAEVELATEKSMRRMLLSEFITGPGKTELDPDELMTAIRIPEMKDTVSFYKKVGTRKANALSKLSCTGLLCTENGVVTDMRLAVGAVAPVVVRSVELEKSIQGMRISEFSEYENRLYQAYAELIVPIDDQRSTAEYRKSTACGLIKEFFRIIKEELS